jgi:hypothetical protein
MHSAGIVYHGDIEKATFINNPTVRTIDGHTVKQKQGLSKALRPEADE